MLIVERREHERLAELSFVNQVGLLAAQAAGPLSAYANLAYSRA
jgi:hypothetical protein